MSHLHYTKTGQSHLDMRFSSSRQALASGVSYYKPCSVISPEIHYRKDGYLPDNRFTSSREFQKEYNKLPKTASRNPDLRCNSSKEFIQRWNAQILKDNKLAPPPYPNDIPTCKDGSVKLSTKIGKEYSNLPKDKNGNIDFNSQEAQKFKSEHSTLNVLDYISPFDYYGTNVHIQSVLKSAKKFGKHKFLGLRKLFHFTKRETAELILKTKTFKPGSSGLFGAGMYFAESIEIAQHKVNPSVVSQNEINAGATVKALVDMGTALIIEGPRCDLTGDEVHSLGCDTVLARSSSKADWEYVVYDPKRITPIRIIYPNKESHSYSENSSNQYSISIEDLINEFIKDLILNRQ